MTKAGRRARAPRRRPAAGRPRRRLRRTARRAGPRTGSRRPPDRRRFGHLAARALAVHVLRRGEPRGHHPAGRPARPDARVRVLGARGAVRRPPRTTRSRRSARSSSRPTAPTRFRRRCSAWLDARAADETTLRSLVDKITAEARQHAAADGIELGVTAESVTPIVEFPAGPRERLQRALAHLGDIPVLPTQAGHDAGILSPEVPTAMLFVRNPTGVSHSPTEFAESERLQRGSGGAGRRHGGLGGAVTDTWWCEHAWLGGDSVTDGVLFTVNDGSDHRDRHRRRRAAGLTPAARTGHSRAGQRAFACLPPGAARPHPTRPRIILDLARPDVPRRRAVEPR